MLRRLNRIAVNNFRDAVISNFYDSNPLTFMVSQQFGTKRKCGCSFSSEDNVIIEDSEVLDNQSVVDKKENIMVDQTYITLSNVKKIVEIIETKGQEYKGDKFLYIPVSGTHKEIEVFIKQCDYKLTHNEMVAFARAMNSKSLQEIPILQNDDIQPEQKESKQPEQKESKQPSYELKESVVDKALMKKISSDWGIITANKNNYHQKNDDIQPEGKDLKLPSYSLQGNVVAKKRHSTREQSAPWIFTE